MKAFSQFMIHPFEWDENSLIATFHYSFDREETFKEIIDFKPLKDGALFPKIKKNKNQISQLLAHLSIAIGVSYYKLFPTKEILVSSLHFDPEQCQFWNEFYIKGLGEFFYQNQIDPTGLANFYSDSEAPSFSQKIDLSASKSLVLFGGGKDSLVTVELLKKQHQNFDLFTFGKDYPLHQIAQIPTGNKRLIISRSLDLPQLKKLQEQGYYNGHLPITGIIAFVSLVVAYLYGYKEVVTSLEKSADEGNTIFHGLVINHQRSKSSEFEHAFEHYIQSFIDGNFKLWSPLRKRYEIRIVQEFCQYPQYFSSFSSCNRNFHISGSQLSGGALRCGKCPKCAFVYTMMRAFLGKEKVNQIFGKDLFDDEHLLPLFKELLGISGIKPFECVGTNEEMVLALWLITNQTKNSESSPIITLFNKEILPKFSSDFFERLEKKLLK